METTERISDSQNELAREREWMACEIHDGLLQSVIAAHMMAESLRAKWPAAAGSEPPELKRLLANLQQAMAEGRQLIDQFHATAIHGDDLRTAVQVLIDAGATEGDPQFELVFELPADLSSVLLQTIYRVVQEAISNIRRHSQAEHVLIRIEPRAPHGVRLMVVDDGCGFEMGPARAGHFGLQSMRRRVESAGGKFKLETAPQEGTRILVELPVAGQ